jgi:hypothetical protein
LIEKIEQIDFRLKNQRDYRGRRPFQFVEVDSSSAAKKLVTNRSRDCIINTQGQFSFIDNSDRRYELDTVLRSVKNELAPLEKARQRSTYEFCTRGQVSRNSDKFETKTYVYKSGKKRPKSCSSIRDTHRLQSSTSVRNSVSRLRVASPPPETSYVDEAPPDALRKSFSKIKIIPKPAMFPLRENERWNSRISQPRDLPRDQKQKWQTILNSSVDYKSLAYRKIEKIIKWEDPEENQKAEPEVAKAGFRKSRSNSVIQRKANRPELKTNRRFYSAVRRNCVLKDFLKIVF